MVCNRCGNGDLEYFFKGSKGYYCRKCIKFSRILLEEELDEVHYDINLDAYDYDLTYPLTSYQIEASNSCLEVLNKNKDVLLHCVCGAGKTEIVVQSISHYLQKGLKVCYAISRKEVVIELSKRFAKIFPKAKVVSLYGGSHNDLYGDLIVCTNHQLYRYNQTFDLLILDEVDAFPLKGNTTLANISLNSCKGNIIYSTATVDESLRATLSKRCYEEVKLYVRPSLKPLIVPRVIYFNKIGLIFYLAYLLHTLTNQCLIFVASKKECTILYKIFSKLYSCTYVYADLDKRQENIQDFKNKKYKYCFTTTVLERGITLKSIDVIILDFNSKIFDESSLIQMVGRVGRSIDDPSGKAYILSNHFDKSINNCVNSLIEANSHL